MYMNTLFFFNVVILLNTNLSITVFEDMSRLLGLQNLITFATSQPIERITT